MRTTRTAAPLFLALLLGCPGRLGDGRREGLPETVPVLVAVANTARYTTLTPELVRAQNLPKETVPPGAITRVEDALDRPLLVGVGRGEVLLESKLASKAEHPPGARAPVQDPTKGPRWEVMATGEHSHITKGRIPLPAAEQGPCAQLVRTQKLYSEMAGRLAQNPRGVRPDLPAYDKDYVYLFAFRGIMSTSKSPALKVRSVRWREGRDQVDISVSVHLYADDGPPGEPRSPWVLIRIRADDAPPGRTFFVSLPNPGYYGPEE